MFLSAEKVSKKFNRTKDGASWFYAVRETDISIDQGTLTAIFGKSGSGKTTLLNMLGGLLAPSEGVVRYGEIDLYRTVSQPPYRYDPTGKYGADKFDRA